MVNSQCTDWDWEQCASVASRLLSPESPEDGQFARDVVQQAVDFIDTADSYGPGVSERLLREAIDKGDVTVATKAGLLVNNDGQWLSRDY